VTPLFIIALVIWAITAIGLVVLVLMHSGKGAGLSETFGGSMDPNLGTGVIEKNLNRITIICASIFIAMLLLMMFIWPSNPIYDMAGEVDDTALEAVESEGSDLEHSEDDGNEEGDEVDEAWDEGIAAEEQLEDDGLTP
jgi:preprotein translocase subunit SecG